MNRIFKTALALGLCLLLTACGQQSHPAESTAADPSAEETAASSESSAIAEKNSDGYTVIDAETAKTMIDAGGVIIVDVRTAEEYAAAHIPGAINVPVESIGTEEPAELPDVNAILLIYCRTGIRAATASGRLAAMGYTNVYDMGGIVDWPYDTVKG